MNNTNTKSVEAYMSVSELYINDNICILWNNKYLSFESTLSWIAFGVNGFDFYRDECGTCLKEVNTMLTLKT